MTATSPPQARCGWTWWMRWSPSLQGTVGSFGYWRGLAAGSKDVGPGHAAGGRRGRRLRGPLAQRRRPAPAERRAALQPGHGAGRPHPDRHGLYRRAGIRPTRCRRAPSPPGSSTASAPSTRPMAGGRSAPACRRATPPPATGAPRGSPPMRSARRSTSTTTSPTSSTTRSTATSSTRPTAAGCSAGRWCTASRGPRSAARRRPASASRPGTTTSGSACSAPRRARRCRPCGRMRCGRTASASSPTPRSARRTGCG